MDIIDKTGKDYIDKVEEKFAVKDSSCSASTLKKLLKSDELQHLKEGEKNFINPDWKNTKLSDFLAFDCLNIGNKEPLKKYNEAFKKIVKPKENNDNKEFVSLDNNSSTNNT